MKKKLFLFISSLFILSTSIYAQANYNDFIIKLDTKNYYLSTYFDVLKESDRNALKKFYPESNLFNDTVWEEAYETVRHKWYEENFFPIEKIALVKTLSNTISTNRLSLGKGIIIDIKSLYEENNNTIISFTEKHYGEEKDWYFWSFLDWKILRKTNSNTLVFVQDGDYLFIYYDKEKMIPFATYAKMNEETLKQFKNLIYNNKCDLSKVTWPRHADGSCDYENKKTSVSPSGSATNVSINKVMTASENLKLRSGEATSSHVIAVMSAGTKVKILEIGKAENIDGINSNWVKVEIQTNAKDRDGKPIKKGTLGWCYGGYLK